MNIFNQVKGMLPEGTLSNLKIPGLPEGTMANIEKGVKTFQQAESAFKQFTGEGQGETPSEFEDFEEDLMEAKIIGGESDADFAKR